MLKSNETQSQSIEITSRTFPKDRIAEILQTPGIYFPNNHILYPVTEGNRQGNHLDSLFIIEPIAENDNFVRSIVEDICVWIEQENIQFDVIFAPAQPAVQSIVNKLAEKTNKRIAYWEYCSTGWFGNKLVHGELNPNDKVLIFNGISQQGRCVGERLPSFVAEHGAQPVAAAVFAKGTAKGVTAAEARYGSKLYSTIQVDIGVFAPSDCRLCQAINMQPLIPWTHLRDKK